ncbi:DNA cytosine methyltransferase [Blautia wexlerae]
MLFDTEGELFCNDARNIETEGMPDFDLLCGGFPCQAFSIAGRREGFADA